MGLPHFVEQEFRDFLTAMSAGGSRSRPALFPNYCERSSRRAGGSPTCVGGSAWAIRLRASRPERNDESTDPPGAGAAAIHPEDELFPKKCRAMAGQEVIPLEEMASRGQAATDGS